MSRHRRARTYSTGIDRRVLVAISDLIGDADEGHAPIQLIAAPVGVSGRRVRGAISRLMDYGELSVQKSPDGHLYRVIKPP